MTRGLPDVNEETEVEQNECKIAETADDVNRRLIFCPLRDEDSWVRPERGWPGFAREWGQSAPRVVTAARRPPGLTHAFKNSPSAHLVPSVVHVPGVKGCGAEVPDRGILPPGGRQIDSLPALCARLPGLPDYAGLPQVPTMVCSQRPYG